MTAKKHRPDQSRRARSQAGQGGCARRQEEAREADRRGRRQGQGAGAGQGQGAARARPTTRAPSRTASDVDLSEIEADLEGEPVAAEADTAAKAKPLRMKVSRAKERALMREFGLDETALTEEEVAKRRQELKTLIKMGKTRGFLTHQEINDHLPEKLVDHEILEAIVSMLNDMGIAVYEQAPDAATLLIAGGGATTATEEEAEEAAEAALSTVDSEFGRTTDPVRMYMREMGTVELLTREGEIEIAKRIEGGLQAMMFAISASPTTIAEILALRRSHRLGRDEDLGGGRRLRLGRRGRRLRRRGRRRLLRRGRRRRRQRRLEGADQEARGAEGGGARQVRFPAHQLRQDAQGVREGRLPVAGLQPRPAGDQLRADDDPLHREDDREALRHPALAGRRRAPLRARAEEDPGRQVRHAAGILHQELPAQHPQPEVGGEGSQRGQAVQPDAVAQPAAGAGAAEEAHRSAGTRGRAARRPEEHQQAHERRRARLPRREEGDDRGQPAPRDLDRQEVHQPRPAVPRPDPGRQHRPDEGGRQVRIPPRLQVLDLRDVVDPPGDHALDRRPGAHDPHPGAHDRDDQQDEPAARASTCRSSASSPTRRRWPRRWRSRKTRSGRS